MFSDMMPGDVEVDDKPVKNVPRGKRRGGKKRGMKRTAKRRGRKKSRR